MFDIRVFLKTNLISAYQSGYFAKEQVAIFAGNHLVNGRLTGSDVAEIAQALEPPEEPIIE